MSMVKKKLLRRSIILPILLAVLLVLFIGSAFLYFYIPKYVESRVLPKLSQMAGISGLECDVRRIGLYGLDLGGLYIGDSDEPSITVESVRLDYSITGLLKKRIDSAVIAGIEFKCEFSNGEFIIPGLDWQSFLAGQSSGDEEQESPKAPRDNLQVPITIRTLRVRNAVIVCSYNGRSYRIPFDLSVVSREGRMDVLECTMRLYPRGQGLIFSSSINLPENNALLKFQVDSFYLDRFEDIVSLPPGMKVSGNVETACSLRPSQWAIESSGQFLVSLEQSGGNRHYPLRFLEPLDTAVGFSAKFTQPGGWEFELTNESDAMAEDFKIRFNAIDIVSKPPRIHISGEGTESEGIVKCTAEIHDANLTHENATVRLPSVFLTGNADLEGDFSEGAADFELKISGTDISSEGLSMTVPEISLGGKADYLKDGPVGVEVIANFVNTEILDSGYNARVRAPSISLTGNANLDGDFSEGTVDFQLKTSGARVSSEGLTMDLPELSLGGSAGYLKDGAMGMEVIAEFENAEISNAEYNAKITGIGGRMPLKWPCEGLGEGGDFIVEAIDFENFELGTASGTIRQDGSSVVFDGNHKGSLLPGLNLNFKGNAGYYADEGFKTELEFSVPRFNADLVDLGEFLPGAEGTVFSGELELEGNLLVDAAGNMECSMKTVVQDASLELEEQGVAVEGISCALSMPDVLSMRSAPNQQFRFKTASVGEISFTDGEIALQIESPETIFVENCAFKWCNGSVYTHAMRVPLTGTDYDVTLYCDRLELSKILEQFGIARAEGTGTVNGRIPIKFTNGRLFVDKGFLYSTPGKGGVVHIAGTDILDIGIPRDIPQYSQLDFAKEALKDFSYKWVTLSLNTEEDDLILQMSLDGKPKGPLPFTYKRELGTFARIEAGSKQGVDYPIHFDINFHFPLNKILDYGQGVSEVMNMFK